MVLRKLFEELLRHGTVVAFTSNQPPDTLYQVRTRVLGSHTFATTSVSPERAHARAPSSCSPGGVRSCV